jgi:hypothetical protein
MKIPHYPTAAAITKLRRRDELNKGVLTHDVEHLSRPRRSPPT